MTLEEIRAALGWCTLINWAVLLWWWMFIWLARDFVYRLHSKWFKLSEHTFDAMHYGGMGLFKVAVLMFNLVPYLALRIVG
jgi:hypothetical protein